MSGLAFAGGGLSPAFLPVSGFAGAVTIGSGGSLSVAADTDATNIFGRWKLYTTSADVAAIAHFDLADGQNYAVRTSSAATAVNGPTGGFLFYKVGDVLLGTMAATYLDLACEYRNTAVISPTQLTGNTDNWAPTGLAGAETIRMSSNAAINLTGLTGGTAGRQITLISINTSNNITLVHSATSTAANQFICPNSANAAIRPNGAVILRYDGVSSKWRVVGSAI